MYSCVVLTVGVTGQPAGTAVPPRPASLLVLMKDNTTSLTCNDRLSQFIKSLPESSYDSA